MLCEVLSTVGHVNLNRAPGAYRLVRFDLTYKLISRSFMRINNHLRFLSVRGVRETSADVRFGQFGKIGKDFRGCHAGSQIFKNIVTEMRISRMHGLPLRLPDSIVIMSL